MASYRAARAPRRKAARVGPIRLPPDVTTSRCFETVETFPASQAARHTAEGAAGARSAASAYAADGTGARWDHPEVRPYARGDGTAVVNIAGDPDQLAHAVNELRGRVHAKTALKPIKYKLMRWAELAGAAGHRDPWAFTEQLITDVMAALVKARFRSADGYLSAARQAFVSNGGQVTDTLRLLCRNLARAARRGQGPPMGRARVCPSSAAASFRVGRSRVPGADRPTRRRL